MSPTLFVASLVSCSVPSSSVSSSSHSSSSSRGASPQCGSSDGDVPHPPATPQPTQQSAAALPTKEVAKSSTHSHANGCTPSTTERCAPDTPSSGALVAEYSDSHTPPPPNTSSRPLSTATSRTSPSSLRNPKPPPTPPLPLASLTTELDESSTRIHQATVTAPPAPQSAPEQTTQQATAVQDLPPTGGPRAPSRPPLSALPPTAAPVAMKLDPPPVSHQPVAAASPVAAAAEPPAARPETTTCACPRGCVRVVDIPYHGRPYCSFCAEVSSGGPCRCPEALDHDSQCCPAPEDPGPASEVCARKDPALERRTGLLGGSDPDPLYSNGKRYRGGRPYLEPLSASDQKRRDDNYLEAEDRSECYVCTEPLHPHETGKCGHQRHADILLDCCICNIYDGPESVKPDLDDDDIRRKRPDRQRGMLRAYRELSSRMKPVSGHSAHGDISAGTSEGQSCHEGATCSHSLPVFPMPKRPASVASFRRPPTPRRTPSAPLPLSLPAQ